MQTHKNAALRTGPAPFKAPASVPAAQSAVPATAAIKSPVFTRDGKKWLVVCTKIVLFVKISVQSLIIPFSGISKGKYWFNCGKCRNEQCCLFV